MQVIQNISKKIAQLLGEDKDTDTSDVNHERLREYIAIDFPSFSSILPYRYYDKAKGLFVNESGFAFGLELSVLSGADEKLINGISDLLRYKLRDGYDIQFVLWGSHQVGNVIDSAFTRQLHRGDIFSSLARSSIDYYKAGARKGFKNNRNLPVTLRDYRLFCFISKKKQYSEEVVRDIISQRDDLEAEFESSEIKSIRITLQPFLSLIKSWINPDCNNIHYRSGVHDEHTTLNEQVVDKGYELICEPDRLMINTDSLENTDRVHTEVTNLSIKNLPDKFELWMSADNFFNVFRASQAIRCPFLISVHARLVPQADAKSKAQSRYLSMQKKAQSVYAKYISGTQETAAEWKKVRDDLASDEIRLTRCFYNVVLFSKKGEAKRDEASAISCFRYNGIELFNTRFMQLQSYLATLPFLMSTGLYQDLQRVGRLRTLTSWNLANLLPLVADYKVAREGLLIPSFRNQTAFFNPFSNELPLTNYNIAVAATSGAGKSFLIQALLSNVLAASGKCFVIDMGHSYKKLCDTVNGVYLEYESLRLNPFSHVHNIQESVEQIRDLFAVLASPSGDLNDVQEEYLRNAIVKAWEAKQHETKVDDIVDALEGLNKHRADTRIEDLITLLGRYTTTGTYPEIFNEYSAIAPEASFVVLELGDLENKPALMKAVLFALILNIEEQMYQSPRDQQKMVVIDEAWRLLAGDNKAAARFIAKGFRTARRHLGSFVTISQSIDDFLSGEEARACWNCSDVKIIMRQNAKAFEEFMDKHENYFSPYAENLIKRFGEAKSNGFSEFMLQIGSIYSFHRLFVDPFSRVMFSSAGNEFEAVKEECANGSSISEAILKVAQQNYAAEF